MNKLIVLAALAATATNLAVAQDNKPHEIEIDGVVGFQDTPMQPDGKWHVHDPARPQPAVVTSGTLARWPRPRATRSCCSTAKVYRTGATSAQAAPRRGPLKMAS